MSTQAGTIQDTDAPHEAASASYFCEASTPFQFSHSDLKQILRRVVINVWDRNISIIAAGVAFFTLLAVFPLITACISIFSLLADPTILQEQLQIMSNLFPSEAWTLINAEIINVASEEKADIGVRLILSMVFLLWSAGAGIRAIMRAMNVAYGERETRSLIKFYSLAGMLTLSVTGFMWLSLGVIIGVPAILEFLRLSGFAAILTQVLPWIVLISLFCMSVGILYLVGPSRREAKITWVWPGAIFATLMWMAISLGFSKFVAAFGSYNATYGSLAAVIVLLVWFWLSAFVVIIGAQINAEMERHTITDTTRGHAKPMGQRGAAVADYRPPGYQDT